MIILMLDSQSFSTRMWGRMLWGGLGLQLELPLGDGESGRGKWEGEIQKEKGRKRGREGRRGSFNYDLIRKKLVREWHWPLYFLHSVQKCNMKLKD
jgi:hypothetical protein